MKKNYSENQVLTKLNSNVTIIFVLLLFLMSLTVQAQEITLASGGDISGSGGTVSYSVGQIVQNSITGTGGSVTQGIQFSFESTTLSVIDFQTQIDISSYPNPTSSFLNIKVQGFQENTLYYKLFNVLGKLLISGDIKNNTAQINIAHLPSATYLLKVSNNSTIFKTYTIIKK